LTISTEPQITIGIKPDGYAAEGEVAYQYLTIPEARALIASLEYWIDHAEKKATT
jgi:hypothetical protein